MTLEYQEILPRKIVNIHPHVDGPWFWGKYTAHPYIGCRSGCEFCYLRGGHYQGRRTPESFDTQIQVKANAVELLRKELHRLDRDIITCGDWQQPAEDHYRLSRGMLEVVRDLSFPLFIVERSPLLTRDLDLLVEINQRAWVGVVYSMSTVDPILKQAFEPRSPGIRRRLQAMEKLATAGILVGTSLMPIFPLIGDDDRRLEETILATREHGGSFVMAGGLTMDGVQAERTLEAARRFDPALEARWRKLYKWTAGGKPSYSPPRPYSARLGLRVRELCTRYNLMDRMPRYVASGPLAINKRIAEKLFLKVYDLELEQADNYRVWAYRKAAWTVDECQESLEGIYQLDGQAGLQKLPGIGQSLAGEIARWLERQPASLKEVKHASSN
jgi:DNA repair photolyase